jgi:hypothetical protein
MLESLPLSEWESFYVIVGSSAAALTGLQFVVIALGADSRRLAGEDAVGAFGTPTIVHFCGVLLIAGILSTPRHTTTTLGTCLLLCGIVGLAYIAFVTRSARRQKGYAPVLEDWIWHAILPTIAYALLIVAGALAWRNVVATLFLVGPTALLLLYIGIHNAWDAAVWMALHGKE